MIPAPYFGKSSATLRMLAAVDAYAPSPENLLLTGPSGTGKSMLAGEIHRRSGRKGQFVATSAPELHTLSVARLVGFARGAFTGAERNEPGFLVRAAGGTLFIDEICHANAELQSLLLTIVESGQFWPVGADRPVTADFRLITAANRPLTGGAFFPELLARLDMLEIAVPSLRDRRSEIVPLAVHLLAQMAHSHRRPAPTLSPSAASCLKEQRWAMNIRELEKVLLRAMLHSDGQMELTHQHIEPHLPVPEVSKASFRKHVTPPPPEVIDAALESSGGSYRIAAAKLDYNPDHLRAIHKLARSLEPAANPRSREIAPDLAATRDEDVA